MPEPDGSRAHIAWKIRQSLIKPANQFFFRLAILDWELRRETDANGIRIIPSIDDDQFPGDRDRPLTLVEKFIVLAAAHEVICPEHGFEPVNLYPGNSFGVVLDEAKRLANDPRYRSVYEALLDEITLSFARSDDLRTAFSQRSKYPLELLLLLCRLANEPAGYVHVVDSFKTASLASVLTVCVKDCLIERTTWDLTQPVKPMTHAIWLTGPAAMYASSEQILSNLDAESRQGRSLLIRINGNGQTELARIRFDAAALIDQFVSVELPKETQESRSRRTRHSMRGRPKVTNANRDAKIYDAWIKNHYATYEEGARELQDGFPELTEKELKLIVNREQKRRKP